MKYTIRDLNERATHTIDNDSEFYEIDGNIIALIKVWSYSGGRSHNFVTILLNGEVLATRAKPDLAIRKALQKLNEQ